MAYSFELDANSNVLLVRFTGAVSQLRVDQLSRDTRAQVDRIQPRAVICDLTEVTSLGLSAEFIRNAASGPPLIPDASCPRVVVAPAAHIFAMSRMFQLVGGRSRPSLAVVRSMGEAQALIGLENPDFKPLEAE